jgi:hypothetical protein
LTGVWGRRVTIPILGGLVVLALAACDSSSSTSSPTTSTAAHEEEGSPRVFCTERVENEIGTSLGVAPVRVTQPRRTKREYSCRYEFADGSMALSVIRYPTVAAAQAYTADAARTRGRRPEAPGLGEGLEALVTTDGSMIVRDQRDVLEVDVAALPPEFGQPPQPRSVIALATAVTIIGHWKPG